MMPRSDLLALTTDDLEALSNRGIVRQALRELDEGKLTSRIDEDPQGNVTVSWSDGVTCTLYADRPLEQASCSIPSATLCRHVIRTVFAYQRARPRETHMQDVSKAVPVDGQPPPAWNPGEITDKDWEQHCTRGLLAKARRLFDEGHLVEVVCGVKPSAYFHTLGIHVRYLVEGDPRYVLCDCREPAPCVHAVVGSWAFHQLDARKQGGLVSTAAARDTIPVDALDEIEHALCQLVESGIGGALRGVMSHLAKAEKTARSMGLQWPAEIIAELVLECDRHRNHDARFDPIVAAELIGELVARCDAIRHDRGNVPRQFVQGIALGRATKTGQSRLHGIGCEAISRKGCIELIGYLQDASSGMLVSIGREFLDPSPESGETPMPFARLAGIPVVKETPLAALGAGQLLVRGAGLSPARRLNPGRAQVAFHPSRFEWENLRPPLLAESFAEIGARLDAMPPRWLGSRCVGMDVFVVPVQETGDATFTTEDQSVVAKLRDGEGNVALLQHPFASRGATGVESLLRHLRADGAKLRFVSGHAARSPHGLLIRPIGLLFETDQGRTLVQPWVDASGDAGHVDGGHRLSDGRFMDPLALFARGLMSLTGETLTSGIMRARHREVQQWRTMTEEAFSLGFARLIEPLQALVSALEAYCGGSRTEPRAACDALLKVATVGIVLQECASRMSLSEMPLAPDP